MILGILSESHGHVGRTAAATRLLLDGGARQLIHCGDIGSESVLLELAALVAPAAVPVLAVLGNVDLYDDAIARFPAASGVRVMGRRGELELDGKRMAVIHGDDFPVLRQAIDCGRYDYVFTGHTHVAEDARAGRTRIINPGAVYRASTPSVAMLDTITDSLQILSI